MALTVADGFLDDVDDSAFQEHVDASVAQMYGQEIVDATNAEGFHLLPDIEGAIRAVFVLPNGDQLPVGMTTNWRMDAERWREFLRDTKKRYAHA